MNEKAKTHKQKAEAADTELIVSGAFGDQRAEIIARLTRPDELLRAAQAALDCPEKNPGLCPACRARLRAARALYEEESDHE